MSKSREPGAESREQTKATAPERIRPFRRGSPAPQPASALAFQRRGAHYRLPRTIRPTREGWWFIGASLAVGLAATNTGNNLLYLILAMMLSLVTLSGVLSEQTMRHLTLRREVPRRIFAGSGASFGLRLGNAKRRLCSYALHLSEEDPAGGRTATRFFLRVPPRGREVWRYSLSFPRRGRQRLPGIRLLTRFPFGLFTKISRPLACDPVIVYPALRDLRRGETPPVLLAGWREQDRRGQGAGLYNLRPYRPGDDSRLVHWKTSAKAGDLMLKELEDEDRPRVSLLLEDPAAGTPTSLVEDNLSYAASLAALAVRQGTTVQLVTADGFTGFGQSERHLDRIFERLALYEVPSVPRRVPHSSGAEQAIRIALDAQRVPERMTNDQ